MTPGARLTLTPACGHILVVDDEQAVLDILGEYLGTLGYTVQTSITGTDALAAVRRTTPDVVLLDIAMPDMDGVDVLRRMRVLAAHLPVIMVTANADIAVARRALKMGAFDYVAKPFEFDHLGRVVEAAMLHAGSSRA